MARRRGFAVGLVLLLAVGFFAWLELAFPAWVLVLSVYVLMAGSRRDQVEGGETEAVTDPRTLIRSGEYRALLVLAAVVGLLVSCGIVVSAFTRVKGGTRSQQRRWRVG